MTTDYASIAIEFAADKPDPVSIDAWVQEFAYQGFDAARIIQLLQKYGGEGWKTDAKKMIVLALTRGNKPEKIMKKMSSQGRATLQKLVQTYKLKSGSPGRDDLTLTRVASALAGWTVQALPHVSNYLPITGPTMDRYSPDYPRCMMHPSFSGLIDVTLTEETVRYIIDAHSLFLFYFSQTINANLRGKSKADIVASFEQQMYAAINSTFMPGDKKRAMLATLGIININSMAQPQVIAAAKVFRQLQA
nr:nucleocapsid protein [Phlebovirus sp.]QSM35574.1 nucleocapsid protein [Phlebovirus sp.]QSM35576.1 nucleocapsid protein [Phlebovirus sp.]QSM35580.1 nucleocapsid protein [Phlebovirus sp.]QSM35582.1 nucleocapsid protein [Phlebovirus sp.]